MEDVTRLRGAVTRRQLLQSTAILSGALWAGSTALIALAPGPAWALALGHLDARAGRVLLTMTRHVYPHATLDDAVYALVVKDLDAAAADGAIKAMLNAGVAALDAAAGGDWLALDGARQLEDVTAVAGHTFFEKVRVTAGVALYDNELAFAHFGYEGESFSKGGYLHRGFNDLDWLPEPPAAASPVA